MLRRSLLVCAFLIPLGVAAAAEPVRLRVLCYNIHHGRGTDGKVDLERIAGVLRSVKPDVVALQEVDQGVERTEGIDEPAELARLTEMEAYFGWNIHYQGGLYGNAVLTRLPIVAKTNHKLPQVRPNEQRGVMEVELDLPGTDETLLFFATHLDYRRDPEERLASVELIRGLLSDRRDRPALLCGDLNDYPDSETLTRFGQDWQNTAMEPLPTYPVDEPKNQIDFILARPAERWNVVEIRVLEEKVASDHRPIFAVLELAPRE